MENVKIDISVNTEKLLTKYPNGGEITTQGIIEMTQKGGKFDYKANNKAKLISILRAGDKIMWKIKTADKKVILDFVDYVGDENTKKIFKTKPAINKSSLTDCQGNINEKMPQETISSEYTFKFCLKKNPSIIWSWDPGIDIPFPPL